MMSKKIASSFWVTALFYTILQRISLFVFGVTAYMILVRGFSTETNGVWALYVTFYSLLEAIKQGLIRNATIRFLGMKEYAQDKDAVQTSSLVINISFTILMVLLILSSAHWFSELLKAPLLQPLLLYSTIIVALLVPYNHCEILLQAKFKFDTLFVAGFIRQGFFFAGILTTYFFFRNYFSLLNVLMIQVVALIASLIFILVKTSGLLIQKLKVDIPLTWKIFHFGKYTFGTNLFAGLSRSFDHFVTANALGPIDGKDYVAYYNTVARINNMVDVPSLAAADVLYPKNVEAHENEGAEKVKYYFEQVTGTILAFIVPLSVFIFIFPRFIIYVIAGPQYYPAIIILQLTILFSIVRPLSYQFGSTLDAIGKPQINFRVNALLMVLNLILTYFLLKTYGGIGAAYATMIYYTVSFISMWLILKKYINLDVKEILQIAIKRYTDMYHYLKGKDI
ncbi:MAG: oligosaccharide flippase family protein [Flavitalea sp.]